MSTDISVGEKTSLNILRKVPSNEVVDQTSIGKEFEMRQKKIWPEWSVKDQNDLWSVIIFRFNIRYN